MDGIRAAEPAGGDGVQATAEPPGGEAHNRPAAEPIRVVLADDHALMRRSLRNLLDCEQNIEVIAEAGDLESVARQVHGHRPHVLVLDLGMPSGSSLESIAALRHSAPETEIVVLTMEDSPVFARQALNVGARAYVLKERADGDLAQAVQLAARGERFVSPSVGKSLTALHQGIPDKLTERERTVLTLIAFGYTNHETAAKLHLSPRTIEAHRARIMTKLGLETRAELVRYALRHGLLRS